VISGSNPDGPTIEPSLPDGKKLHQERVFLTQPRNCTVQAGPECTVQLDDFLKFCEVDLRLKHSTAMSYRYTMRKYLGCHRFIAEEMRDHLSEIENGYTYNDHLKAFIANSRFLNLEPPKFRFSRVDPPLRIPPSRKDLRQFYDAIDEDYEKLAFLGFVATGLRRNELLEVRLSQINQDSRTIIPNHQSTTKRSHITFYNAEFQELLEPWLSKRCTKHSDKLFSISGASKSVLFMIAQKRTGLRITPQDLRFWFANEMARLGVPDRFIDAFQGRVPRSILARHYSDYSMDNLKAIYDRAGLTVLTPSS
jgi:integrase